MSHKKDALDMIIEGYGVCTRDGGKEILPAIECQDGTVISVQGSYYSYCEPKDNMGQYYLLDIAMSDEIKVPSSWKREDLGDGRTNYGFVPVGDLRRLVEIHGGVKGFWKGSGNPVPCRKWEEDCRSRGIKPRIYSDRYL